MLSANLFNVCRTGEISNFIKKKCICLFNRSGSYFTLLTFVVEVMTTCSEREIPDSLDLAPWLCCSDSRSSPLRQGLEFSHHHTSFQFGEHGDDIWPHSLWRCRQPFTAKKSVKYWDKKKTRLFWAWIMIFTLFAILQSILVTPILMHLNKNYVLQRVRPSSRTFRQWKIPTLTLATFCFLNTSLPTPCGF